MKIDLLSGSEANTWTWEQANRDKWKTLYSRCPWGTVFQSEEFVLPWYDAYHNQYTPIIVLNTDSYGELTGLLTMAVSNDSGELLVAGGGQAEYQTWLADPQDGSSFINAALQKLSEHFPHSTLRFLFVPPSTPLEWLSNEPWAQRCELRHFPRPLMSTKDASVFNKSLGKKRYKSRLNRLARTGEVRLERISCPQDLEAIFDQVISYGSFRHAAIHDVPPRRDPLKKQFYLAMMEVPRLLHATLLRVGDEIAASHIGFYNKDQVLLGMLAHSPSFARYSPSKLHVFMLGEELAKEGITALDLTPGGEYKDRYATHYDDTHVLTVFFDRTQQLKYKVKRKLIAGAKYGLQVMKVTPEQVKDAAARINHKWTHTKVSTLPPKVLKVARKRLWTTMEMRIYSYDVELARQLRVPQLMNRDCLPDVMAYQPAEAWQMRFSAFLKRVLTGLEGGNHVYTRVEDGRLVHYGWLIERQQKSHLSEVGHDFYLPPESAVLADFYTHPAARGKGLYQHSLRQMVHDASLIAGTKHIFIGVLADNFPSRHVIEKVGFDYRFSFFARTIGGKTNRWTTAPAEFTAPGDA
jgi:CelD/BcsL family acetyltransferase involved in cellulose biosynthesis/RimJ/RimL family protein N-acetyltransferase